MSRRGRKDVKEFMIGFRNAFPDLNFWGAADLIAEGDYVVGRWEGAAHTPALLSMTSSSDHCRQPPVGKCASPELPCSASRGKIAEEVGLDDGATALQQLNILRAA